MEKSQAQRKQGMEENMKLKALSPVDWLTAHSCEWVVLLQDPDQPCIWCNFIQHILMAPLNCPAVLRNLKWLSTMDSICFYSPQIAIATYHKMSKFQIPVSHSLKSYRTLGNNLRRKAFRWPTCKKSLWQLRCLKRACYYLRVENS